MSDAPPPLTVATAEQVQSLARALRFTVCAVVVGISCFNAMSALTIGKFQVIFNDMLGGKQLPALSALVLTVRPLLCVLSLLIPLGAIALLFLRDLTVPIYLSVILAFGAMAQLFVTNAALLLPFADMLRQMSGG